MLQDMLDIVDMEGKKESGKVELKVRHKGQRHTAIVITALHRTCTCRRAVVLIPY